MWFHWSSSTNTFFNVSLCFHLKHSRFILMSSRCFRSKRPSPQQQQEEEFHYGEVTFQRRPEAPSVPEQDGLQQETVYSQVKVSMPRNKSAGPEDLYRWDGSELCTDEETGWENPLRPLKPRTPRAGAFRVQLLPIIHLHQERLATKRVPPVEI